MKRVDVIVVGAGVAGTTAAIGLARQGLDVLLVDRAKFPRHKVCGCCLNSDAVEALEQLGLGSALRRIGARPIEQIAICSNKGFISVPSKGGLAVSRYALDAMLHDAAVQAGCRVQDQTSAKIAQAPHNSDSLVRVHCSAVGMPRTSIQASTALIADGLAGSSMADRQQAQRFTKPNSLRGYGAHLPAHQHTSPPGRVVMYCGPGGYVGTVVLEDGSLDIAAAMQPCYVKSHRGPAGAVRALMHQSGRPLPGMNDLQWKATAPLTGGRKKLWMRRMFFLGDSAGYVEPFTGEGMAWAMRSAQAVQPIVRRAVARWDDALGEDWTHAYRDAVQRHQWRCRLFSQMLRRPRLVSSFVRIGAALPRPARQTLARSFMPPMFRTEGQPATRELITT